MEDPGAAPVDYATVEKALRKAINEQDVNAVRQLLATPGFLRDDALFLKCLEYCWFLDPWKRVPSEADYARVRANADTEPES